MTEIELNEKLKEIERERCNALPCQPNRRTGKAYRRQMHIKKNDDLLRIVIRHYVPHAGYVDWDFDGQTLLHSGKYIKYPKNSLSAMDQAGNQSEIQTSVGSASQGQCLPPSV